MKVHLLIILLSIGYLSLAACSKEYDEGDDKREGGALESNDYHLYDLLEKAKKYTGGVPSLYALFSLPDDAPVKKVTRAFHTLSRTHHPDKNPQSAEYHALLTAAHTALKNDVTRNRLKWLLEEADPMHHYFVYTGRKYTKRPADGRLKFSVRKVAWGCLVLSILGHFGVLVVRWASAAYRVYSSRRQVSRMGRKEMKRMERKLTEAGGAARSAASPVHQLQTAQSEYPSFPSLLDLWPLFYARQLLRWVQKKVKTE